MDMNKLIDVAKSAMGRAYAPYSNYKVGVALVCKNGKVFTGCNIENYGIMSICAERVAFTKAISEGEEEFHSIVVCGGTDINNLDECLPCGYCRQFITEFVDKDFIVYSVNSDNKVKSYRIEELLPNSFKI